MEFIKKKTKPEFNVILIQIAVVTVLIITLTFIKFFAGDLYYELRNWYIFNFEGETRISEVLEEPETENTEKNDKSLEISLNTEANALPDIPAGEENIILTAATSLVKPPISSAVKYNTLLMPVNDAQITSVFGERSNPITNDDESHKGLDLAAKKGSDIFAAADGTVTLAQKSNTYGNYIIIDHGNGLKTLYAHCNKLYKSVGDNVKRGDIIAAVGSTGQSTGPHLHFEVIKNGEYMNPQLFIGN